MGTKLNTIPQTEKELNELLQNIYLTARNNYEQNKDKYCHNLIHNDEKPEDLSAETIKKLEKYRQKLKTDIIRK